MDPFSLEVEASLRLPFGLAIAPALPSEFLPPGTKLTVSFTSPTSERRTVSGHFTLYHALRKDGSRWNGAVVLDDGSLVLAPGTRLEIVPTS